MSGVKKWATTVGAGLVLTGAQSCSPDKPVSSAAPQTIEQIRQEAITEATRVPADMRDTIETAVIALIDRAKNREGIPFQTPEESSRSAHSRIIEYKAAIKPVLDKMKDYTKPQMREVLSYVYTLQLENWDQSSALNTAYMNGLQEQLKKDSPDDKDREKLTQDFNEKNGKLELREDAYRKMWDAVNSRWAEEITHHR